MLRNVADQAIGAQMISLATGMAFTDPVTVYVTGDAGVQQIGAVGGGLCTAEGNGYFSYRPAQYETDYANIAFTFTGLNAIPTTVQVQTLTVAQAAAIAALPGTGVTAYSAGDLGTRALRLLGVIDATETPSAEDAQTAFAALNDMVDDWGTQRQTIYKIDRSVFPLVAGQASYTLGWGGEWHLTRPVWIDRVSVIPENSGAGNTGPMEISLGPPLDIGEFQRITIKTAQSSYPQYVYWDRGWANGLSNVQVYPVPTSSNAAIVLYTPVAITAFPDMATKYTFPPGYARALRFNLAIELASEYGISPAEETKRNAQQSLANIKRANNAPVEAQFDAALVGRRGRYNTYTDTY